MPTERATIDGQTSALRAIRQHLAVVLVCLALGAFGGWAYADSSPTTYTSSTRVLVNPSVGNPFAPTPSSVRQDEQTSLETEAQVARSAEVLGTVADEGSGPTLRALERGVQVTVPPNTQILQISYSAGDPAVAQQVADAVAKAYLENRDRRFNEVNSARIDGVETQTLSLVKELRAATAAAQVGSAAERAFQAELADALRNELVSLRAQRTSLENSESPAGTVISPASTPARAGALTTTVLPVGGALAGLALGCLLAMMLERLRGVVRSVREVEATGLPVVAAVPSPKRRERLLRRTGAVAFQTTVRRLRAAILELEPRPNVIAVVPAGAHASDGRISEAVADSFAKAGHRVVLVQTDDEHAADGLAIGEPGLAQTLLDERLNVLDLLQPSDEPLLSLLPPGRFTDQSRELLVADRLRAALSPLVKAGHLVVIASPGFDSAEGEAVVAASDLGLVVVAVGRTRTREIEQITKQVRTRGPALAALVVTGRGLARRTSRASRSSGAHRVAEDAAANGPDGNVADPEQEKSVTREPMAPARR